MEFPHLGKHCSEENCHKLDFLPMKCDACDKVFCSSHFSYLQHSCPAAHKNNLQVPVCPLCGEPVPVPRGISPDETVGQHIDQYCKSDTKKIFINKCTYKACKKKELFPVTCTLCKNNFCLRHRHSSDHECKGSVSVTINDDASHRSLAANAAEYRRSNKPTSLFPSYPKACNRRSEAKVQTIQGNMTEDEALARALALSIMELDEAAERNRRSEAATEQRNGTVSVGGSELQQKSAKDKCLLS